LRCRVLERNEGKDEEEGIIGNEGADEEEGIREE
jgi:hypothetical protein